MKNLVTINSKVKSQKAKFFKSKVKGQKAKLFLISHFLFITLCLCAFVVNLSAQSNEFTYQGRLLDNTLPATANYDFEFSLWDALANGAQQGTTQTVTGVAVANGIFTVRLNFGAQFDGAPRFLQINVRPSLPPGGTFTTLAPRQPLTSTPYSIRSSNAASANSVSCSLCITDAHISSLAGSKITGLVPSSAIPSNLANYIQSSATLTSGTFNIGGWGRIGGRLGVGTENPISQAHIESFSLNALRVQKNTGGGIVASFGENGIFNIDAAGAAGGRFTVFENGNVGIGINNPATRLHVGGTVFVQPSSGFATVGIFNPTTSDFAQTQFFDNTGTYRGYIGYMGSTAPFDPARLNTVEIGTNARDLTFRPNETEVMRLTTAGNVGIGTITPSAKLDVINSGIGANGLRVQISDPNSLLARFGEYGTFHVDSPGVPGGRFRIQNVLAGGTVEINNPGGPVENGIIKLNVNGLVRLNAQPGIGAILCVNAFGTVMNCGASSIRYKKNVADFNRGLDLLSKLRPVSYEFRRDNTPDLGLVAEEVAEVEPLLVTYNDKGEIEGVRYDRIGVVLVNVVKEQQAQIEAQQKELVEQKTANKRLQDQIDALKKLVCSQNPTAELCQPAAEVKP